MKKILLTAACLFVASPASAGIIAGISMEFYDATNTYVGYSTTAAGFIDTTAVTGHVVGWTSFFGTNWSADVAWASETVGMNTWSGTVTITASAAPTAFNYTFNLAAGDVAVGLYFDWAFNNNIPVLAVFRPDPFYCGGGSYFTPVDQVWYKGTSTTPKMGMQTSPFPGQMPKFSGFAEVPEPASLLLIGSGLAGLVGLAGRRRRGH